MGNVVDLSSKFPGGPAAAKLQTSRFLAERPSRIPDFEIENEALLALTQCLADSPSQVLTEICKRVLTLCNCESAGVSLLQPDESGQEVFFWPAIAGAWAPYLGGKMPRNASPCGLVIDGQSTMIFQNVERHFPAAAQASPPIAELLLLPFYVEGKPVGTVWALTHHSGYHFDSEDERRLKSLSRFASPAYQFSKSKTALQSALVARDVADAQKDAAETKWEKLFHDLKEGFIVGELVRDDTGRAVDWRYLQINRAWTKMLGLAPEKVVGRTIREVFPQTDQGWIDDFARAVDTGEAVRFTRQAGTTGAWYDGVGQSAGGDRFTVMFIDVTEREHASRRQKALMALGDMLRDSSSEAEMTQKAAQIVGEALEAQRACYGELDEGQEHVGVVSCWVASNLPSVEGQHRFSAYGNVREDILRGNPLVIEDIRSDPRTEDEHDSWNSLRTRAVVNMPIMERGKAMAVLIVHFEESHAWTEGELAFLRNAGDRLEIAIAKRRAEERQSIINHEIVHRQKNTLTLVQAIASQTLRTNVAPEIVEAFTHRIQALGRAQDILFGRGLHMASLREVIERSLETAGASRRCKLDGPMIWLGSDSALTMSLLSHELVTNAFKYGALSENGSIEVSWQRSGIGDDAELVLDWAEYGGPAATAPARKGFGSKLLSRGLSGTGGAELRYEPEGFHATFRANLKHMERS